MYDIKALYEARSVPHAIELMEEHPEALILAGGSDIIIKIREGRLAGCELISIYGLDELRGVSLSGDGELRILPLTSFSRLSADALIQKYIPVLGEAVDQVGGPQIRNIGTIGGNICNGVTSADSASTLMAWDAVLELTGPGGVRRVPIGQHYVKAGKVNIKPAELLTAICIPEKSHKGYFGHYIKYSMRGAMDIATMGCSVNVRLSSDKSVIEDARIAFGVAAPVPVRAPSAEEYIRHREVCPDSINAFAERVLVDINPRTSWRASQDFRRHISVEMARRAITEAIKRAGGEV